MVKLKWVLVILALVAALGYLLMGVGLIHAADLTLDDAPPGFTWIAGAFYVTAGLLLFLKKRWIYRLWAGRTDVLFSLPGLMTKIPQLLLEIGSIYLLVKVKPVAKLIAAI